jgi:colanic acid/amylovoran biosynthesis glycosyltransferase
LVRKTKVDESKFGGQSVVYVVSVYPAVSHTFIQREIFALRRLGVTVHTVGLRPSNVADLLTATDREEHGRTRTVRPISAGVWARSHLRAILADPARYLMTALSATREGVGVKDRARRVGYFLQAAVVWNWCRELGVRHLHAHFERPAADVAMLAVRLGGQTRGWSWSFTAHRPEGYMDDRRGLARKVRESAFVVCVSHYGASQLMGLVSRERWGKLHVIRCGIDVDVFARRRPHSAIAGKLLTVARLEPVKGHGVLLEALALLKAEGLSVQSTVVGDGSQRSALERLAETLGIDADVEFTGSLGQDVIRQRFEEADAFCLPSFDEGVPVVLMEAMAMGLPVVATRVAGVPELVEDGVSGALIAPGMMEELARALSDVLRSDAERRAEMGQAGRMRVSMDFNGDSSAEALHELFAKRAAF